MAAVPDFQAANDPDTLETQEWIEALDAVIEREGPERAHYLLETEFGLDTYGFTSPPEAEPYERVSLSAYATYRLVVLGILSGDVEAAQAQFDVLQQNAETDTAWYVFFALASEFWQEYQATQNLGAACDRATAFVESSEIYWSEVFTPVSPGVCDPYVSQDICPFE